MTAGGNPFLSCALHLYPATEGENYAKRCGFLNAEIAAQTPGEGDPGLKVNLKAFIEGGVDEDFVRWPGLNHLNLTLIKALGRELLNIDFY